MPDFRVLWADLAREAYDLLPQDRRDQVDLRLSELKVDPTDAAVHDLARGWWTASYADGSGLVVYAVSDRHHQIVLIRLVDLR